MKRFLGVKNKEKSVELDESGDTKTGVKRSIVSQAQENKNTHCRLVKLQLNFQLQVQVQP